MNILAVARLAHAALASALPTVARDALGVAGLASIAYGCWLLAPAAGFIVGGIEAVAICALATAAAGGR